MLNKIHDFLNSKNRVKVVSTCPVTGNPLLTRYKLIETPLFDVNIHVLHQSDEDRELHCHPWNFATLILKNGYKEHTPQGVRNIKAGSLVYRPHHWRHKIELFDTDKPAVTLNIMGRKMHDDWGFYDEDGRFTHYREFLGKKGCL